MEKFDIGLAYEWEYDEDFINLIEEVFHQNDLNTFKVSYYNINEVKERILDRKLFFNFYFDRAWDVDENFEEFGLILSKRKTYIFNSYKKVLHSIDKATMHLEFISAGLTVPYSIIIPPHSQKEEIFISVNDLAILGRPFIIKPCNNTGGGVGVVTGAESLQEIIKERVYLSDDKYILQEKIIPVMLNEKRAWFRSFFCFGKTFIVWWDDQSHLYSELTDDELNAFNLQKLFSITKTISKITGLDFFSTEIALNSKGKFIAVDYVNDQCDMRFKSKHFDGVPDNVIHQIVNAMKDFVSFAKKKYE